MTTGGYSIGFKELYDLVTEVGRKLDVMGSTHSQQIQANSERIETMSKGMKVMWERLNAKSSSNWQINLAIAGAVVSFLTSLAGLLLK